MALVQIPPVEAHVRWDRSADRPTEISWEGHRVRVTRLDAVRDDSPASKAGLKAGDKIVKLAGREIKNVYDYTYALGEMKPDQEYEVEVLRGGERLKMKLTPQARR